MWTLGHSLESHPMQTHQAQAQANFLPPPTPRPDWEPMTKPLTVPKQSSHRSPMVCELPEEPRLSPGHRLSLPHYVASWLSGSPREDCPNLKKGKLQMSTG